MLLTTVAWSALHLLPDVESGLFAQAAARLCALFTASPVVWSDGGWTLMMSGRPVVVSTACSATDFFLMSTALIAWRTVRSGRVRGAHLAWFAVVAMVAAALFAIGINTLRIIAVAQAHRWVIPQFAPVYRNFLHLATGVAVFLPSLIAFNALLEATFRKRRPAH